MCPVAVAAGGPAELLLGGRAAHQRAPARSGPTSTPTRTTRWPTSRPPAPRSGARPPGASPTSSPAPAPCGTITGIARYLKAQNPDDPDRSPPTPRARCSPAGRAGRTSSRASARTSSPPPGDPSLYDEVIPISDEDELPHRPPGQPRGGHPHRRLGRHWPSPRRSSVAKRGRARRHRRRAQPRLRPRLPVARLRRRVDGQLRLPRASATSASPPCSTPAATIAVAAVRQPRPTPCARRSSSCAPTASASCRCARTRRRSPTPRCRARSTSST